MRRRHSILTLLGALALGLLVATPALAAEKVVLAEDFGSPS